MVLLSEDPTGDPGYWSSLPMPRFDDNDDLDDELDEPLAAWELELLAADGHDPDTDRLCVVCGPGEACPALADESPLQEAQ